MEKEFCFTEVCSQEELKAFDGLYDNIEVDPYVKEGYRFKNIMRVRAKVEQNEVVKGPHEPLFQSKKYNPVHGDIVREYTEIPSDYHNHILYRTILTYAAKCGIGYEKEILVQAQRIKCNKALVGLTAVEGPHSDGKEFVAIFCINRQNVEGGVSQILEYGGEKVIHSEMIEPGSMMIVDDREYFHYATPVTCIDESVDGFRDIFIFSTPSSRPSEILY